MNLLPIPVSDDDRADSLAHLKDLGPVLLPLLKARGATAEGLKSRYDCDTALVTAIPLPVVQSWLDDTAERGLTTSKTREDGSILHLLTSDGRKEISRDMIGMALRGNGIVRIVLPGLAWLAGAVGFAFHPHLSPLALFVGAMTLYMALVGSAVVRRHRSNRRGLSAITVAKQETLRLRSEETLAASARSVGAEPFYALPSARHDAAERLARDAIAEQQRPEDADEQAALAAAPGDAPPSAPDVAEIDNASAEAKDPLDQNDAGRAPHL